MSDELPTPKLAHRASDDSPPPKVDSSEIKEKFKAWAKKNQGWASTWRQPFNKKRETK